MPDTIGSAYVEILPDVERFIVELRAALNEAIGGRQSVDVAANVAGVSGLDRQIAEEMAAGAREGAVAAKPGIDALGEETQGKMRDAVRNGMQQGAEEAAAERAFGQALTSGAQDALGALRILGTGVFQVFGGIATFLNPGGSGGGAQISAGLNTIKGLFTQTAAEAEAAGTSVAASWEVALPALIAIAVPLGLFVASLGSALTLLGLFAAGLVAVASAAALAFGPFVALGAAAIALVGDLSGVDKVTAAQQKLTQAQSSYASAQAQLLTAQRQAASTTGDHAAAMDRLAAAQDRVQITQQNLTDAQQNYNAAIAQQQSPMGQLITDLDSLHQHLVTLATPFANQIATQLDQMLVTLAPLADQLAAWFGPRLTSVLGQFSNFIGSQVVPALLQFATWYGHFIDSVIKSPEAGQILNFLGDVMRGLLGALEVIIPVLNDFARWFLDRWPEIKKVLDEMGKGFAAGFDLKGVQDMLKSFSDTLDYVSKHSTGLRAEMGILGFVFSTLVKIIVGAGVVFLEIAIILGDIGGVFSWLGTLVHTVVTAIGGFFSWLGTQANNLNNTFVHAINGIGAGVAWLEGQVGNIFSGIGTWIRWLGDRFSDLGTFAHNAVNTVGSWFSWLGSTISGLVGVVASWVRWLGDRFSELGSFASNAVNAVASFFSGLPGRLAGIFGGLAGQMLTWGGDVVNGFVNGITGAFWKVVNAAQGLVNSLGSNVSRLLGLGSPSRLAQSWGEAVIEGFQLGLRPGLDMRALSPQMPSVRAPTQVVNITVQAAQPTAADVAAALAWAQRTRQVGFALTPRIA